MAKREIDADELQVLEALEAALNSGTGWARGGVRGWLLGEEVNDRAHSAAGYNLQRLRNVGFVRGEAVPDPGRPRVPRVLWRITQAGEDELAARTGRTATQVPEPQPSPDDEGVVFISHDAWRCLSVLQGREEPTRWTAVVEAVRKRFHRGLYYGDAKLLLNRGLAEESMEGEGRWRVVTLAATPSGRSTQLVDGKASEELVQVRIRPVS